MSRVGTTSNLDGTSKYDILSLTFPDGYPVGGLGLGFGETPKRISGVEKVVQVFLKTLLTTVGSDVVTSSRGTYFPSFTGGYNLQSTDNTEIISLITVAVEEATSQAKSILNVNSAGLTSQLESITLGDVDHDTDGTSIYLTVLTKSGETAPIALPFTSLGIEVNA